jgi:SAM-dependent methyltransferase
MFSTDPGVYGAGLDLRAGAATIEAALRPLVTTLAEQVRPPFTPARRRTILAALATAQDQATRLGQLVNRYTVETRDPFPARVDFLRLSRQLGLWQDCTDRLQQVIRQPPLPLLPDALPPASAKGMENAALERLFEHLHLALSPKAPPLMIGDFHGDIPLPMTRFLHLIRAAGRLLRAMDRPEPWSFLDVGCGLGLKLLAAQEVFGRLTGVEIDAATARRAKALLAAARRNRTQAEATLTPWLTGTLPHTRTQIHFGNALNFPDYGNFDVIYAYRPIANTAQRHLLEHRIVAQARPGALLILPYPDAEATGCYTLAPGLYWKQAPGLTTASLLARAAHIGPQRAVPVAERHSDEGFVAPLAQALRHWGHLP